MALPGAPMPGIETAGPKGVVVDIAGGVWSTAGEPEDPP